MVNHCASSIEFRFRFINLYLYSRINLSLWTIWFLHFNIFHFNRFRFLNDCYFLRKIIYFWTLSLRNLLSCHLTILLSTRTLRLRCWNRYHSTLRHLKNAGFLIGLIFSYNKLIFILLFISVFRCVYAIELLFNVWSNFGV